MKQTEASLTQLAPAGIRRCAGLALVVLCLVAASLRAEPPPAGAAGQQAPPLVDPDLLLGVEDKAPIRNADENQYEYRAYTHLLLQARKADPEQLARRARRDLTYAHLFEQPGTYRGEPVHIQGRLKRLRKFDAPAAARAEGITALYEGWVFDDLYFANPYCVVVTELGPGVQVGERVDQRVTFDGFFFKRYRYKAGDTVRDCPLLIGHVLALEPASATPPESPWSFQKAFLPAFLGLLVATGLLAVGLTWWFRRSDRLVQARIASTRIPTFLEPEPAPPASLRNGEADADQPGTEAGGAEPRNGRGHEAGPFT